MYWRRADGTPEFVEACAPTNEALQSVLHKIITRTIKLPTCRGVLVEEEGSTYMADSDGDSDTTRRLRPLQAAACSLIEMGSVCEASARSTDARNSQRADLHSFWCRTVAAASAKSWLPPKKWGLEACKQLPMDEAPSTKRPTVER